MFKNRIILIALILFLIGSMFLVVTYFLKPTYEVVVKGNQNANVPAGGILPGTGEGFNANIAGGEGGALPNINVVGRVVENPPLDEVAKGGKTKTAEVINERVLGIHLTGNEQVSYYNRADQKFYRLTSTGEKVELSEEEFPQVQDVTWSPDAARAIIQFPDGTNVLKNFTTNERITLPREGKDFVFQGDTDQVVFKFVTDNPDRNYVVAGDPGGADVRAVEHLGDKSDLVQTTYSPDGSVVALYRSQTGPSSEEIFFIGQQQENFKSMDVQGFGFKGAWTPDGNRLIYSVISPENGYNPTLWIVDAKGDAIGLNNTPLSLSTTIDSCTIDSEGSRAYCSVPKELPEGAGLYPELFADRETLLYEINLNTGLRKMLADPVRDDGETGFIAKDLQLSEDGRTLFFVDGKTEKVYKIKIKIK